MTCNVLQGKIPQCALDAPELIVPCYTVMMQHPSLDLKSLKGVVSLTSGKLACAGSGALMGEG